jgi:hypothetical protein
MKWGLISDSPSIAGVDGCAKAGVMVPAPAMAKSRRNSFRLIEFHFSRERGMIKGPLHEDM